MSTAHLVRGAVLSALMCAGLIAQVFGVERHRLLPMQGVARASAADLDGDGDQDLIGFDGSQLTWLRNLGGGRFAATPLGAGSPGTIGIGDLDGDGDRDIVIGQPWGFAYLPGRLFRNDGAAGFTDASTQWPTTTEGSSDLELFDYDGDGDLDIVTANGPNGSTQTGSPLPFNHLYRNNGAGVFTEVTAAGMPNAAFGNRGFGVATGDLDADGDSDLVFTGSNVRVFVQNAAGVAIETPGRVPVMFPASVGEYSDVALLDVDGDGDLDLLAASTSSQGVLLFTNDGAGNFAAASAFGPGDVSKLHLADFDGDGRRDLLTERVRPYSRLPLPILMFRNTAAGFLDVTVARLENGDLAPSTVSLLDCDADGDMDIAGSLAPQPALWHNDGQGNLRQVTVHDLSNLELQVAVTADIEGDGDLDLAAIDEFPFGAVAYVVENPGTGIGSRRTELVAWIGGQRPRSLAWIDADRDGDQDLFVGHDGQNRLFHRVAGGFVDVTAAQLPLGSAAAARVGDINGDGIADLVTASAQGLYLGTGTGGFVDVSGVLPPPPVPQASAFDVVLLDHDQDGDLDVAQALSYWGPAVTTFRLLRNDWPLPFVDVTSTLVLPTMIVSAMASLDIDRDGRQDLLFANRGAGNGLQLLRSVGQGFVDETALRVPMLGPLPYAPPVAVVDFDGDGWSDVILRGSLAFQLRNTAGVLQPAGFGTLFYTELPEYPACADFDGDGDQDVVVRYGVVRNRARDLQIAAPPRLGQPGELVLHAHAGDGVNAQLAWLFVAAALGPPLPLPGLGTLALDPARMQQVALLTLPAAGGEASYSFVVPAQPSLLGAQVFAQALFAHRPAVSSWRLGNWVRLAVRV